jgi:hypothetical protein
MAIMAPSGGPLKTAGLQVKNRRVRGSAPFGGSDGLVCLMPIREFNIHAGRKRVDLAFANAGGGFFGWLALHHPAGTIFVECKNYSADPANPELDQLAGRFGPTRGEFGFLCCRPFENKPLFVQRCRDTALDGRGFIIALDHDDLIGLMQMRDRQARGELYRFLEARFQEIT